MKKKLFKDSAKSTCTSSDNDEDTCKISEGLVKNCRRSCAHKVPTINSELRTTNHAPRKTEYYVPLLFFEKAGYKNVFVNHYVDIFVVFLTHTKFWNVSLKEQNELSAHTSMCKVQISTITKILLTSSTASDWSTHMQADLEFYCSHVNV